jgi:hypothetical protein
MLLPMPSLAASATVLYLAQPVAGAVTVVVVVAWIGVEAYAARGGTRQRDALQDGGTKTSGLRLPRRPADSRVASGPIVPICAHTAPWRKASVTFPSTKS